MSVLLSISVVEQGALRYRCTALFSSPSIQVERLYTSLEDNAPSTSEIRRYYRSMSNFFVCKKLPA